MFPLRSQYGIYPKCFIFSCVRSIKSSVTRDCLGRITGCFESNGRSKRSILPPSLMRSSSSKNGVRLYNDEAFDIGFPFDRFSTPYLSALFRDSTSFPKYLACSLLISHISASRSSSADSGTGHAFLLFFEEEDGVFLLLRLLRNGGRKYATLRCNHCFQCGS